MQNKIVILGSGIAGISAGYHLKEKGQKSIIYEKDNDWGGLCGNFVIDGFRFDRFVHFSFADNEYIKNIFSNSCDFLEHVPYPNNYYKGYWLKHPAQNNLSILSTDEKIKIIIDFINRPIKEVKDIKSYDEWLRCQYGNYFAEEFPFKYTRKYWGLEAKDLETKWVGIRMSSPSLEEVLKGAFDLQDKCFYYAKIMKYPTTGGYRSILNKCREGLDIRFNKEVIKINTEKKEILFKDGSKEKYDRLISSLPLPEIVKFIDNCPTNILNTANKLHWTCGYQISLGFNKPNIAKDLWFYIYDEDILSSRVYSPNLKSPDNVPEGCSSLQAEVFYDCKIKIDKPEDVLNNTITKLIEMKLFKKEDLIVKDIRFEKYANVTFTPDIYENRQIILDYLNNKKIESIGRFGKWDYLWSHQAFETGMEVIK